MLRFKTWLKWTVIVIGVILAGTYIWAQLFMENWLRKMVKQEVATLAEKHYTCTYDTLLINTFLFHFELRNVALTYDHKFKIPEEDPYLITGKAQLLRLRRFDIIDLILFRKISMNRFEFISPQFQFKINPDFVSKNDSTNVNDSPKAFNYGIRHFRLVNALLTIVEDTSTISEASLQSLDYDLKKQVLDLEKLSFLTINNPEDSIQLEIPRAKIKGFNLSKLLMQRVLKFKDCGVESIKLSLPQELQLSEQFGFLNKKKVSSDTTKKSKPFLLELGDIRINKIDFLQGGNVKSWVASCRNILFKSGKLSIKSIQSDWNEDKSNPFIGNCNIPGLEIDSLNLTKLLVDKSVKSGKLILNKPEIKFQQNPNFVPEIKDTLDQDSSLLDKFHFPNVKLHVNGLQVFQGNYEIKDTSGRVFLFANQSDFNIRLIELDGLETETIKLDNFIMQVDTFSLVRLTNEKIILNQMLVNIESLAFAPRQSKFNILKPQIRSNRANASWDNNNSILKLSNMYADLSEAEILWSNNNDFAISCPQISFYEENASLEDKRTGKKIACQSGKFKFNKAVFNINAYNEILLQVVGADIVAQLIEASNSKTNFAANIQNCITQTSNLYFSKNLKRLDLARYSCGRWSLGIKSKWQTQGTAIQFLAKDCIQKLQVSGKNRTDVASINAQVPGFQWNQYTNSTKWQLKNISLQTIGSYIDEGKLVANQVKLNLEKLNFQNSHKKDSLQLEKTSIQVQQFVTPLEQYAPRKMKAVSIILKTGKLKYSPGKSLYRMAYDNVDFKQDGSLAKISAFQLIPKLTKKQFSDQVKRTIARADIKIPEFILKGISVPHLFDGKLICSSASIKQARFDLYKDQNIPLRDSDLKKTPQVLLKGIKLPFNIPVIKVENSFLRFEGIGKDATKAGVLWFSKINGNVFHAGNMNPNLPLELKLTTIFMDEGSMSSYMKFPMNSGRSPYSAEFQVGPMNLDRFNVFFAEFAEVKVVDGKLKSVDIHFEGDTAICETRMTLKYDGLQIKLLERKGMRTKQLLTIAANAVLLQANPSAKEGLRVSEVETEFQPNLFVIGNWMKGFTKAALTTMSPTVAKFINKKKKKRK